VAVVASLTQLPEKPPSCRSAAITRWHGTIGAKGLRRIACACVCGQDLHECRLSACCRHMLAHSLAHCRWQSGAYRWWGWWPWSDQNGIAVLACPMARALEPSAAAISPYVDTLPRGIAAHICNGRQQQLHGMRAGCNHR
jgi:hypothetical protein